MGVGGKNRFPNGWLVAFQKSSYTKIVVVTFLLVVTFTFFSCGGTSAVELMHQVRPPAVLHKSLISDPCPCPWAEATCTKRLFNPPDCEVVTFEFFLKKVHTSN